MKGLSSTRHVRRIAVAMSILAAVVSVSFCRGRLLGAAGHWLNVGSPLDERVDDVMVLGGEASTRPFVAAALIRAGLASQVLVPKSAEPDEIDAASLPPHHEIIRQVLIRSGVSRDAIVLLPTTVDSTDEEARCLADFLAKHPTHSVAVITSDFHTRRTRMLFRRACRQYSAKIHYIGAPTDSFDGTNWWMYETGFVYYVNEYLKLARALTK